MALRGNLAAISLVLLSIAFINSNASNSSSSLTDYSIDLQPASYWNAGSGDDLYFQLCNDDMLAYTNVTNITHANGTVTTKTENVYGVCLDWYLIDGGMPNGGSWYDFEYNNQTNIYPITTVRLLIRGDDTICLRRLRVNGTQYDNSYWGDCASGEDPEDDDKCGVITVTIDEDDDEASFVNQNYDGSSAAHVCPYNVTGATVGPPTPTENGTRNYDVTLEVSAVPGSGTDDTLYLRLCTDQYSTDCTRSCNSSGCFDDWFEITGVDDTGNTWDITWNTDDIGNVSYVDIVTFGNDMFCINSMTVDGATASGYHCIDVDEDEASNLACSTMRIDLDSDEIDTSASSQCAYGIRNEEHLDDINEVIFKFKTGSNLFCGADFAVYFIFCDEDGRPANYEGHCSDIYKIGQMSDEGTTYTFDIDITDYDMFETLEDVQRVDMWAYATDTWCLSDVTLEGKTSSGGSRDGPNADSTPAVSMETDIGSDADQSNYCAGVIVHPFISEFRTWSDGEDAETGRDCRWNDKLTTDSYVEITSVEESSQTFFEWVQTNWLWVCLTLIGIVICCICGCAVLQKKRKEQVQEQGVVNTSGMWHGGNAGL